MGLSDPAFTFTIPSVIDHMPLDCRIHHPARRPDSQDRDTPEQRCIKGAIIAHPYAPLGGCYDDPVVYVVVSALLRAGFIVGTFNFRGAGGSKGRTSWTGKPELSDYISVVGFFALYLQHLAGGAPSLTALTTAAEDKVLPNVSGGEEIHLILGGYSYGSLMVKRLPPISNILSSFCNPAAGSAQAEIARQAQKISDLRKASQASIRRSNDQPQESSQDSDFSLQRNSFSVTMTGEESDSKGRRASRESRRSIDVIRSLDIPRRFKSLRRRSFQPRAEGQESGSSATDGVPLPQTYYLLISPVLPPLSLFTAISINHVAQASSKNEGCITQRPTLCIFGGKDFFTSAKKLRTWAQQLEAASKGAFQSVEIAEAGHFWTEQGVKKELQIAVRCWTNAMFDAE